MKTASEFPPLVPRDAAGRIDLSAHTHVGTDPGVRDTTAIGCFANEPSDPPPGARFLFRYNEGPNSIVDRYALVEGGWIDVPFRAGDAVKSVSSSGGILPPGASVSVGGRRAGKSWFNQLWMEELAEAHRSEPYSLKLSKAQSDSIQATLDAEREQMAVDRAARKSPKVTLTYNFNPYESVFETLNDWVEQILPSDKPGIAAATKRAEPTPDPVVSVLGQQVAESELAAALEIVRAKNAPPPEPQAPRGPMFRDDRFDHRLGAWR